MTTLQPDQQTDRWDDYVSIYETVFEPVTNAFAIHALDRLGVEVGDRLIDVASGCGGTALLAAERGADVVAIDASRRMVERVRVRAQGLLDGTGSIRAKVMDGMELRLPDAAFDSAISVFGIILLPDAVQGLREIRRILKPGGRAAVVTWTEPERYELVARLFGSIAAVRGPQPAPPALPAQLRFREKAALQRLVEDAGLTLREIVRMEERWRLPSAHWLAENIAFAPGMAAMISSLGNDRPAVLRAFVEALEGDQGKGEITLTAVAHAAIASKP